MSAIVNGRSEKASEINKGFSEMIWDAEMNNQKLSEFLDTNPDALREWIALENKCKELGLNPVVLACKELSKEELSERI
jgi:hypothetical protein